MARKAANTRPVEVTAGDETLTVHLRPLGGSKARAFRDELLGLMAEARSEDTGDNIETAKKIGALLETYVPDTVAKIDGADIEVEDDTTKIHPSMTDEEIARLGALSSQEFGNWYDVLAFYWPEVTSVAAAELWTKGAIGSMLPFGSLIGSLKMPGSSTAPEPPPAESETDEPVTDS